MELIKRKGCVYTSIPIKRFNSHIWTYTEIDGIERFITTNDEKLYDEIYVLIGPDKIYVKRDLP